jgi:hypothetical protein
MRLLKLLGLQLVIGIVVTLAVIASGHLISYLLG